MGENIYYQIETRKGQMEFKSNSDMENFSYKILPLKI